MATKYVVVWNRPFGEDPYPLQTTLYADSAVDAAILTARTVPDPIWCKLLFVINWDTQTIVWGALDPWPPEG